MGSRNEPYEAPAIQTFASELTAWRTDANLTKTALAEILGYTPQWISQIEAAKSVPSKEFAENLDTFFTTNGLFKRLQKRIIDTRHQAILPPGFAAYQEREAEASQIRAFDALLFHGLLQAESYMRAVVGRNQRAEAVDQLVSDRLGRQKILASDNPPDAWFTIDETLLRRMVGGPDVMRDQLRHLLAMQERPNIWIDVVPQDTGYYAGLGGSFTILGFARSQAVAYIESAGQGILLQEAQTVANCEVRYNSVRGDALRVGESRDLIASVMEEIST
jgi:transcriptional regulator with XRE-family HTH domain